MLSTEAVKFIESQRAFYIAVVCSRGWPHVQHRIGPPGLLRVDKSGLVALADYHRSGDQLILAPSTEARVALSMADHGSHRWLTLLGFISGVDLLVNPEWATAMSVTGNAGLVQRVFTIRVEEAHWNCPIDLPIRAQDVRHELALLQQRVTGERRGQV